MAAEGIVDNIPVGTDEDFYDRYDQRQVESGGGEMKDVHALVRLRRCSAMG